MILLLKISWHPEFTKGWYLCQLEVMECKEVAWPDSVVEAEYSVEDCGWTKKDVAFECKINLLTGRTHQVLAVSLTCGSQNDLFCFTP